MIKKIDLDKRHSVGVLDWFASWNEPSAAKLIESKINELVDAVNELQTRSGNVQDKFAEQRKWIGKLCRFWHDDKADKVVGILTGVFDEADRPFERNIDQTLYKHCESVKPDDDIIYKKEQQ